jgi:hypothetical protein
MRATFLRLFETYAKVAKNKNAHKTRVFAIIIQFFIKEYKHFYESVYIMNENVSECAPIGHSNLMTCSLCNYNTKKQFNYNKHLLTKKHLSMFATNEQQCKPQNTYSCACGKIYKFRQSLYNHKQVCTQLNNIQQPTFSTPAANENANVITIRADLFIKLIQQNVELIAKCIEHN